MKLYSIKNYKKKYKVYVKIKNKMLFFYISSIFENNIKNLLAALTVIKIYKNVEKLKRAYGFRPIIYQPWN